MNELITHSLLSKVAGRDQHLYRLFTSYFKVSKVVSHRLASAKLLAIFGGNEQNIADDSRQMFVPPPGYLFNQNDLEGAEAVVVALLCIEGAFRDCVRLKIKIHNFVCVKIFSDKFYDLISPAEIEALTPHKFVAHPNYKLIIKRCKSLTVEYDLAKRTVHGCLTADHEVLTPTGWIKINEWNGQPIMVWSHNRTAHFELPSHYYEGEYDGMLHTLTNRHNSFNLTVTDCHKMPYYTNGKLKVTTPDKLPIGCKLPYTGFYQGVEHNKFEPAFIKLLAAFQSDGTITDEQTVRFHLKKDRKIQRLRSLVAALDDLCQTDTTYNDGTTGITLSKDLSRQLTAIGKTLGPYIFDWSCFLLQTFLEEYQIWDGCVQETSQRLLTTNEQQADWLCTMAHLCGYAASKLVVERPEPRQTLYNIGLSQRQGASYDSISHRTASAQCPVYCFTTSTGFFYVRRAGTIMVTGNSNYQMGWKTFQATVLKNTRGRVVLSPAQCKRLLGTYFDLFPEIKVYQALTYERVRLVENITNLFGYEVKFVQRFTDELVRLAVSWAPQSTIGVLACLAAIKHQTYIENEKRDWHLHNIVHDSCLQSAPEGEVVEAANRLDVNMRMELTSPIDHWKFTIGVEKSIGRNWGKKSETNPNGLEVVV